MIFLGCLDSAENSLPSADLAKLQLAISRAPQDLITLHSRNHFVLLVVEDDVYQDTLKLQTSEFHVGLVSGRPYIEVSNSKSDANAVLGALLSSDSSGLSLARGSFCALSFDAHKGVLRLCSDKVGIFPIYVARVGSRIYFASALRMLQALPGVCGLGDIAGLFTQVAFGYPLARRTVYANVGRLYGGEVATYALEGEPVVTRYWRWDKVAPVMQSQTDLAQRIHGLFLDAVRIRTKGSAGDLSFLSGGLDSRCIVAALREIHRPVWTLNFAPEGAQDHLFGRLVAEKLGATHFELGLNSGSFPERQRKILDAWSASHAGEVDAGLEPYRVWSGDGGSVGLGHVYLDAQFIALLRKGATAEACEYFVRSRKLVVPAGMLRSSLRPQALATPLSEMCEEVGSFQCPDPGKSGLLFLLLNDQRHHLAEYFENLDLHRFELVLPFFDAHLLEAVVAAPLDAFMRHEFYNRWLDEFPPGVADVPWQAYPGHAPCPVSSESYGPLRYQWKEDWFDSAESERRFRAAVDDWGRALSADTFPDEVLNRRKLRFALWMTRFKLRDYSYVLDAAKKVVACQPS